MLRVPIDPSSANLFSTPIAWYNGCLYTVDIEPPDSPRNGINLKTVVRKGSLGSDALWHWESNVVENRTIEDRYHTQASLAVDKNGFVHIAYNMHNMPWQYKISRKPEDISSFIFKGEKLTHRMLSWVKYNNRTPFPGIGGGAIPGNQITYPAFFLDRDNELYITYRFAIHPGRKWKKRGFAGGVAKYDADKGEWNAIGGKVKIARSDAALPGGVDAQAFFVRPFAYDANYTVYLIRLDFDADNTLHAVWTWRKGGAGRDCSHPSYANHTGPISRKFGRSDGSPYDLPIGLDEAEIIANYPSEQKFFASTSISCDPYGQPYVILDPIGSSRVLVHYNRLQGTWSEPEPTPHGATEIYIDDAGKQWAFASGLKVFMRNDDESAWKPVYAETGYVYPKIIYVRELKGFIIHTCSSDFRFSKITWIQSK